MSIEAMKAALEALELVGMEGWVERRTDAIIALRQAIADAEKQEPFNGRILQRLLQTAWKKVRQEYKDDPECCFALGFDAGIDAVAPRVEPAVSQSGGGFESLPASPQAEKESTLQEISDIGQEIEQEHKPWCDYLNIMLTSLPPQRAKCNCKQAKPEPWDTSDMAHRSGGLSVEQAEKQTSGKCGCGANLFIDEAGNPCSKAPPKREQAEKPPHTDHPMRHWDRTCPACVAEAEQEPVPTWYSLSPHGDGYAIYRGRDLFHHGYNIGHLTEVTLDTVKMLESALNAAPPKREWVGLTDDEVVACWARPDLFAIAHAIEAKLRERNT